MGIRDDEIERLKHYAKGLGVKVIIYNKDGEDAAQWTLDGTLIQVFAGPGTSKTEIILSLIHELGHHVWFIHEKDRQQDLKFDQAITRENLVAEDDNEEVTPKNLRKKIYEVEKAGTGWWESIYKETNLKIPLWKLHAAMEFDIWMYEMYYETGLFPKGKLRYQHYLEVQRKHKPK
jgi:hypothetical protein